MTKKRASKNSENKEPTINVPNRDIIQRLNFLYQASVYLSHAGENGKDESHWHEHPETKTKRNGRGTTTIDIAKDYVKAMKTIGTKTNTRIDPSVKRTICKFCNAILLPGFTAKIRVKTLTSHKHAAVYICMMCSSSRQIPVSTSSINSSIRLKKKTKNSNTAEDAQDIPAYQNAEAQNLPEQHVSFRSPFFARAEHSIAIGNNPTSDPQ